LAVVVLGPQAWWFSEEEVSEALGGAPVVRAGHKDFPDGETYVRLPLELRDVKGEDVLVVQSLAPPQDKSVWQLLLLVEAAVGAGARSVLALVPYLAYARQDKRFLPGEPVSVKVLLKSLAAFGARALFTIDAHSPKSLEHFGGYYENVLLFDELAKAVASGEGGWELAVIAPDAGALERAKALAEALGASYDYLEKYRDRLTGEVKVKPKALSVRGKVVVIADDVISTGGTVALAARSVLEQGAEGVVVAASHALMAEGAFAKLSEAGVKAVYALDTLPPKEGVRYVKCLKPSLRRVALSGLFKL